MKDSKKVNAADSRLLSPHVDLELADAAVRTWTLRMFFRQYIEVMEVFFFVDRKRRIVIADFPDFI